ncbi:MAG: retron St85 family effector protein [Verrucomicrobiae bacterium]|nr:retron St85 family effector protein [Verrucomicrobiae bacterium]
MTSFTPELFLGTAPIRRLKHAILHGTTYLRKDAKIIFVCGANSVDGWTSNREKLLNYSERHLTSFKFFRAEKVFEALEGTTDSDLLSIEDDLGKFSDCIIVICESESAFAELGAFALSRDLAKQLLVINDQNHAASQSFINLGPIKKADRVSTFKPTIFTDFGAITRSIPALESRLNRIPHKRRQAVQITGQRFDQINRKLRLLFVADLINLLGPISPKEIVAIVKEITTSTRIKISTELALGVGLGLFSEFRDENNHRFFFHSVDEPAHLFDYGDTTRSELRSEIYRVYRQRDRVRLRNLQEQVFGT